MAVQLVSGFSSNNLPSSSPKGHESLLTESSRKSLRTTGNGARSRAASTVTATAQEGEETVDDPAEVLMISAEQKRYRDIGIQAENFFANCGVQTDASWAEISLEKLREKKKKKKSVTTKEESVKQQSARAANLTPMDKLKEKATAAAMKRQYNVQDYYRDDGCAQRVARHPFFDNLTIFIVMLNSIWLGVDADLNPETVLWDAHPAFIVAENFFCLYFTVEITIRFLAFQRKYQAFKDFWFNFDFALAILIIVETWITPLVLLMAGGSSTLPEGSSLLRLIRLVRLVRLTRLTRLLRSFPELMIIVKGLAFAARSVCVFSLLWAIITYAFAILFKQLTEGSTVGTTLFQSVPESLNTLLLPAVFGANADIINQITNGNPGLWPLIVFFMALVSVTIMYMLLGVLVDVIGAVAATEKQKIEISYIVGQLREELEKMSIVPEDMALNQQDFQNLVMEPGVVRVMQDAGVNVDVFADMLDMVWDDSSKTSGSITFTDLVNMVLNMRGSNPATVKDCKEQIRVTNSFMKRCFVELSDELDERFAQVRTEIQNSMDDYNDDEDFTESQGLNFQSYEVEVVNLGRRTEGADDASASK
ncbi:Catsper2 [Symbiodinium pilosum]|uniref:Catsper2 protein n=1 Tax=Symbiodinium pilosum TaxID=2952 RepID=A0A812J0A8_SYMPI|nr:Catsper2 [Symbiodinium pilosum]